MLVEIEFDIFDDSQYFDVLDELIWLFLHYRHRWEMNNYYKIQESPWLEQESRLSRRVEDLKKMYTASGYITTKEKKLKRTITISRESDNISSFTPQDALEFLNTPVYIIVENFESDKFFLKALIHAYKLKELERAFQNDWLRIEGVGGIGEIPKKIDDYFENHQRFPPKLYIWVDSDRKFPGDDHHAQPIVDKCAEKGLVTLTILYKRAIENYLPLEALRTVPDELQHVYKAYHSLNNPDKWDYYNMKKGFEPGRNHNRLPQEQEELFEHITNKDQIFQDLRDGFEAIPGIKFDLYTLFETQKTLITRKALQNRCKHQPEPDELEHLLEGITSLL